MKKKTKIWIWVIGTILILGIGIFIGSTIFSKTITIGAINNELAIYICNNGFEGKYSGTQDASINKVLNSDGTSRWQINCDNTQINLINFLSK